MYQLCIIFMIIDVITSKVIKNVKLGAREIA